MALLTDIALLVPDLILNLERGGEDKLNKSVDQRI
jgi:hypothetical protein